MGERHHILHLQPGPNGPRPHCETGPALAYPDGWAVYALNGVTVPAWVVMTPAEQLDPRKVIEEPNVQVRAELIRKIGIERLLHSVGGRLLDSEREYELYELSMGPGITGIYLKMQNPSVPELWHVEGVGPACRTVRDAIHFRKPAALQALAISEDGADWYQQGDVCIWPAEATAIKQWPSQQT